MRVYGYTSSFTRIGRMMKCSERVLWRRGTGAATWTPTRISIKRTYGAWRSRSFTICSKADMLGWVKRHKCVLGCTVLPGTQRNLFVQTEETPNEDALKFKPNVRILPQECPTPFLEYLNYKDTLQPPFPSPLAGVLLSIEGVIAVFFGEDYITITKDSTATWQHIKPEVFSLIAEYVTSGKSMINGIRDRAPDDKVDEVGSSVDSLAYNEEDDDVVSMIKELLSTRIRPAIQEDGGDIEFCGFEKGIVMLKLRGACRTCDSSTITLRNGIESMLKHYIDEVKGVEQLDNPEAETAIREFARFEEKLRQQKQEKQSHAERLNDISNGGIS